MGRMTTAKPNDYLFTHADNCEYVYDETVQKKYVILYDAVMMF